MLFKDALNEFLHFLDLIAYLFDGRIHGSSSFLRHFLLRDKRANRFVERGHFGRLFLLA